jgi:predicted nucleic acid-binding protein
MKVYLDNCCFNRPFDNQTSLIVKFETDAKLYVQELIKQGDISLVWSFVLDYENNENPFEENKLKILEWKTLADLDCDYSDDVLQKTLDLMSIGLRQMDAAHLACAIVSQADCFLTTDKKILNKNITEIAVLNPIDFIRRYYHD